LMLLWKRGPQAWPSTSSCRLTARGKVLPGNQALTRHLGTGKPCRHPAAFIPKVVAWVLVSGWEGGRVQGST
jgi:hypothetical protein